MFRLFRTIRQNLLAKNRLTRYLLYAVGEIVLVVIGILIALQLNIKKEEAGKREMRNELLIGIQSDLKLEAERIDYLKGFYGNITEGIQKIIIHHQGQEKYSNRELGGYFFNTLEFRKFYKYNTSYQTLYGSGLLQKIEDKKLSEEIITYYTKRHLEWSLDVYQDQVGTLNFNNLSQFQPLDKLQSSKRYEHIPDFKIAVSDQYNTDFNALVSEPEALNFLVDLLDQSELVFSNLDNYKESNRLLSNQIQNYLEND